MRADTIGQRCVDLRLVLRLGTWSAGLVVFSHTTGAFGITARMHAGNSSAEATFCEPHVGHHDRWSAVQGSEFYCAGEIGVKLVRRGRTAITLRRVIDDVAARRLHG